MDDEVRRLLWQILKTRYEYTSVKIIHSSWEQLMRYICQGNPKYAKIRLNDLYRIKIRNGAAPAGSCLVDGCSILTEIMYVKGTNITLQPNTIYYPEDDQNKGWDRLIVLEVFEVSPGSNTSERYLLPLFIQSKFSKDSSTIKLDVCDVNSANEHCKKFIESFITFDSKFPLFRKRAIISFFFLSLNVREITISLQILPLMSCSVSKRISNGCMDHL